ncbi:uncharacterized protein LOC134784485 [Penaeus indicus]|uniref:uncharacterized protein LOC134784485 n=1 Tax=Penaeus indicus TaxID=29960 RepID=UPI00300D82E0
MATERAKKNESDLAEMSLSDFLKGDVSLPAIREDFHFLARPAAPFAYRERREQTRGRGGYNNSRGGGGRGNRPAAPTRPWKEGVRAGVMVAHDPPPVKPLRQRNTLVSQSESILTMGLHEAKKVKENVGKAEGDGDLEAVLTNGQQQEEVSFVYRQKMSLPAGQQCHFFPVADLFEVRRDTVLKLLVGLLNAGERGVVYMGVAEDGTVHGITADAQMVAQFVHGIMNTVKFYLMPRLHVPQYGVRYTNVTASSGHILSNVWVVELHAVPQMVRRGGDVLGLAARNYLLFLAWKLAFALCGWLSFAVEVVTNVEDKVNVLLCVLYVNGYQWLLFLLMYMYCIVQVIHEKWE